MSNTESLYQELVEMTKEFAKSSIDDLYHSVEKEEEARELREWYKNHPLKFEDLNLEQRRELGFGTWSKTSLEEGGGGECELIPLWVFRLLDPEQILVCPLSSAKGKIAYAKNCDDDTRVGVVAFQFHRNPTEEELGKLEEDEEESVNTLGDLMKEAIKERKEIKNDILKKIAAITSDAKLAADLTWNARKSKPEVDVEAVVALTLNLAKFGFSEVTITIPDGLGVDTDCRYAEQMVRELRIKDFHALCHADENGGRKDIYIDWSHLLKS